MNFIQILILLLIVLILPALSGLIWLRRDEGYLTCWVYGLLTEWAFFFVVCVPNIIMQKELDGVITESGVIMTAFAAASLVIFIVRRRKNGENTVVAETKERMTVSETAYLCLFIALWLFQMYKTVFFAFSDGDDAYYVALAQTSAGSGTMYLNDVYVGEAAVMNYRYALAPLPMWFAGIARITGINAAMLSHTILAPVLISATYIVYGALARILFADSREKQNMFMTLIAVFCLFSNVSQSMAETFLLTRSRQGKAALANLIIPMLLYLIIRLMKREEKLKVSLQDVMLLTVVCLAGSLTSLFSNVLTSIILFALLIYSFVKKSSLLTKAGICFPAFINVCIVAAYYLLSRS